MKEYSKPIAEKIEFSYKEQVVASSYTGLYWADYQGGPCTHSTKVPGAVMSGSPN